MNDSESYDLKEVHTRFLFPFFFDQWSLDQASSLLQAHTFSRAGTGATQSLWLCNPPAGLYQDEVLQHVTRFLFRENSNTCRYLKLSGNVTNAIFHHGVTIKLASGRLLKVKPSRAGVELFLMAQGVGLLSIALTPDLQLDNLKEIVEFNYRLARYDPMPAAALRIPHPKDDEERRKRLEARPNQSLPDAPDNERASKDERLGAPGGIFTIPELIETILLEPLEELNCRKAQQGLSVYTVARFSQGADFGKTETREHLTRLLSALAQVEEPGHAGAVAGEGRLTEEVLNRKHWAAVGLLGAVHLIADQRPETEGEQDHPFNDQRLPRVRDKYFIPFLMASMQRLFLERTIREAGAYMEFSREPGMRYFMKKLRAEVEEALVNPQARVFAASGKHPDVGLQGLLNQAMLDAADAVFGKYRNEKKKLSGKALLADEDKFQDLSFFKEDLKRAISDACEDLFLHADKISRHRLRQRFEVAMVDVIDGVFLQHRHFARQLDDVLQFAVQGHFVQVSSRQVLHRFYRLAQTGLDVPEAWQEVNYAISNLDRKLAAEREHAMAKTMGDNLTEIGRVQRAVHVLEFVIIGVYAAEVFHIFTSSEHAELPYFSYPIYVALALVGGVLLALVMNYIFARLFDKE